jgi:hypothetical protein
MWLDIQVFRTIEYVLGGIAVVSIYLCKENVGYVPLSHPYDAVCQHGLPQCPQGYGKLFRIQELHRNKSSAHNTADQLNHAVCYPRERPHHKNLARKSALQKRNKGFNETDRIWVPRSIVNWARWGGSYRASGASIHNQKNNGHQSKEQDRTGQHASSWPPFDQGRNQDGADTLCGLIDSLGSADCKNGLISFI